MTLIPCFMQTVIVQTAHTMYGSLISSFRQMSHIPTLLSDGGAILDDISSAASEPLTSTIDIFRPLRYEVKDSNESLEPDCVLNKNFMIMMDVLIT